MISHNILYILNDYSYFKKRNPVGPKSLVKLIKNLSLFFTKNIFIIKSKSKQRKLFISKNQKIYFLNQFIKIIIKGLKCKPNIIIVDRDNIIPGLIIKVLTRSKIVIRFLGYANRLNSSNRFSYKNLIIIFLKFIKCDLTIQTIDMSFDPNKPIFLGNKNIIRFNGLMNKEHYSSKYKSNYGLTFMGRLEDSKGIDHVINFFNKIYKINNNYFLDILGFEKKNFLEKYNKLTVGLNINFHGFVDSKYKFRILRKNKFFISGQDRLVGNAEIEAIFNSRIILFLKNLKFNSRFLYKVNFLELEKDILKNDYKLIVNKMNKKEPISIKKRFFNFEKIHNDDTKKILDLIK